MKIPMRKLFGLLSYVALAVTGSANASNCPANLHTRTAAATSAAANLANTFDYASLSVAHAVAPGSASFGGAENEVGQPRTVGTGLAAHTYDAFGRVLTASCNGGGIVTYFYDANGNRFQQFADLNTGSFAGTATGGLHAANCWSASFVEGYDRDGGYPGATAGDGVSWVGRAISGWER